MTKYTFISTKSSLWHETVFGTLQEAEEQARSYLHDHDETILIYGGDGSYGECFYNNMDEKVILW